MADATAGPLWGKRVRDVSANTQEPRGHQHQKVRLVRDPGEGRRYELWMTTLVDLDTGTGLRVVDPQGCAGVKKWLAARSAPWHNGVQVEAIDLSARFGKAITDALP
jgi:hypothetical protein